MLRIIRDSSCRTSLLMEPRNKGLTSTLDFWEIISDSSNSVELQETQKTMQYYENIIYGVPQELNRISMRQEVILNLFWGIQKKFGGLEQQQQLFFSRPRRKNNWPEEPTYLVLVDKAKKVSLSKEVAWILEGKDHE